MLACNKRISHVQTKLITEMKNCLVMMNVPKMDIPQGFEVIAFSSRSIWNYKNNYQEIANTPEVKNHLAYRHAVQLIWTLLNSFKDIIPNVIYFSHKIRDSTNSEKECHNWKVIIEDFCRGTVAHGNQTVQLHKQIFIIRIFCSIITLIFLNFFTLLIMK